MIFLDALPYIIIGIIIATLIDTIGSIASRKLDIKYTHLAPLSLANYFAVGYFAAEAHGLKTALAATFVIGVYDSIIGLG